MDAENASAGLGALRRIALASLVAVPLFLSLSLSVGSETAQASCTYNVGSGPDHSISFRSNRWDSGGYGAWDMGPGQSQCWYGHGWSDGWFGSPDCWASCSGFGQDGIDVDAHGWIVICDYVTTNLPTWSYTTFNAQGAEEESGVSEFGYPPGCTGPTASSGASSRGAGGATGRSTRRAKARADAVFFSEGARSRRLGSITFHVHSARGEPLGSVCMAPGDVAHLGLGFARKMGVDSVYVGIAEHPRSCAHPRVAGRERAGRPRPDDLYPSFCQETHSRVVRVYRHPDDFEQPDRPSCD